MSYQAVIRDNSNVLVVNSAVGMQISILQGSVNGAVVYVETQTPTSNTNGLVSIEIGAGTVVSGTFAAIDWVNGPFFIQTETDPTGGANYSIIGTSQLLSVPYALYAKTSGSSIPGPQGPAGPAGSGGGFTHYIGEKFGGGVVFHVWKDSVGVEHGLVVATTELPQQVWSNVDFFNTGGTAWSDWDGLNNSNGIVAQQGHTNSAAKACLDFISGGQSDWYLPSIDELKLLCSNGFNVNQSLASIQGASQLGVGGSGQYWSSTENSFGSTAARIFLLGQFSTGFSTKDVATNYVRAIRKF
ncbi:MAG: DUF1566 domain-containing protein [Sphingomonadales bacterium]|nr:DUF1566 domain-containing protein [Sphingomonadales bacterium]